MIFGIGTDIVQISRIELALARSGDRFAEKILGVDELKIFSERNAKNLARGTRFLATRFAAKEAFSKAIGLGMRMPMSWRSIQTLNDVDGKPAMQADGKLREWLESKDLRVSVSISDEAEYALAFVIVEKREPT
ncbi:holo-ACP synthase [Undibacterium piscinae]|uniref:Holo-[acyl-carrier-protein] synthase n=1 Tax=Undibacterium piscinae TaxID=2495591 RepID=A0A6M4A5K2_9BURK|nr:holo-ACP synthase [Undibacterium piscinae]